MESNPIQIEMQAPQAPEPISMPTDGQGNVLPQTAASRATRAAVGLSAITGKTQPEIQDTIEKGKETDFRQEAAFRLDGYNAKVRNDLIADTVSKGRQLSPEMLEMPKPTDPNTVFERAFSNAFAAPSFGETNSAWIKYSALGQAKQQIPEYVDRLHYFTKEVMAKDQYIRQKLEEVHDKVEGQSWAGWGWDQIKTMFQPYNEYKLRGNVEGVSKAAGFLLGSNLKAQADALLAIPKADDFIAKVEPILKSLEGNPTLQAHFMQYLSQEEGPRWDNFWTGAMFAGGASTSLKYLKIAKEISGTAKGMSDLQKEVEALKPPAATDEIGPPKPHLPDVNIMHGEVQQGDEGPVHERVAREATTQAQHVTELAKDVGHGLPDVNTIDQEIQWGDEGPVNEKAPNVAQPIAQGDLGEAAVQGVINDDKIETGTVKNNPTKRAVEPIASAFRKLYQDWLTGQDVKNRINEMVHSKYAQFMGLLSNQRRIDRIPDISQNEQATRAALELSKQLYPELSAHVADVRGFLRDPVSNNWYAQMILTQADGQQFQDVPEAIAWAEHAGVSLNLPGVEQQGKLFPKTQWGGSYIEQQGGGFHIVKDLPIDETQDVIRQFYGSTKTTQAPWGPIRAFTSWISTPESSWSPAMRAAAQIATEGPSAFYRLAVDSTKYMQKLSRSEANDLNRMLKTGQTRFNEQLQKLGYYFKSTEEYSDAFQREIGRIPADHEHLAYFEFVSNMEMDYWLREASIIRNQARWGAQEWQPQVKGLDGTMKEAPWINARRVVDQFPRGRENSIAVINNTENAKGFTQVKAGNNFSAKEIETIEEDMKSGKAKLLQIWDTDLHQLKGFGSINEGHRVQYVLTYNAKDRPLSWGKQLGRTEGGHLESESLGYLSQARVSKFFNGHMYGGDTNLFGIHNAAEGRKLAKIADEVRIFKLNNDEAGARAHLQKEGFPAGFQKLWEAFEPSRTTKGEKLPARLSLTEPIQYRPKDKSLMDLGKSALEDRYGKDLIDGTRYGNPARSHAIQYTGERDAYDFWGARDVGTKYNPLFHLEQDEKIDAVSMMNRGLGRIINSIFMDDYKTSAVNHWLFGKNVPSFKDPGVMVGAAEYLEATREEIAHAPFYYFNNPKFKIGTPLAVRSALEADFMKIKSFIGVPSKFDTFLHDMEQKISDSIYGQFGPKALKMEPLWKLSALSDAPRFLRSVIFNSKMGFLSPRQFFIHAFTFINAALIAPKYAGSGAYGAFMHGWSAMSRDPNILKMLDERASKFNFPGMSGWKPGEWLEANKELVQSGFNNVDLNQLALKDNPMANNIIKNKTTNFLDAGMSPFRAGVKSLKTASWYTAFKEFRDINPTGPLRDADRDAILLRANDLSHNMSRASTSSIQKGFMTFGAMFSSYNLRLAELLIGKRLTVPERARLFFGYATIFGVPTAGGILGLSTYLRGQVDKGNVPGLTEYVPGYDFASTAVMEGLLPILEHKVTGLPLHNWGESFGAKDLDIVDSALSGDKTMLEALGGAAYSTLGNTMANSMPLWHMLSSQIRGDGQFTLTPSDAVQFLSEISTVSYARRAFMGASTGKWMSRNGAYLEPTSPDNAIFSSILGLSTTTASNIYDTSALIKERRAQELQSFKEYGQEMQKYYQAMVDNNPTQAQQYGKRATWILDSIPTAAKARAISQSVRDSQPMVDRINWSATYDRSVPDAERQRMQNIYGKQQEMQQRNQQ